MLADVRVGSLTPESQGGRPPAHDRTSRERPKVQGVGPAVRAAHTLLRPRNAIPLALRSEDVVDGCLGALLRRRWRADHGELGRLYGFSGAVLTERP